MRRFWLVILSLGLALTFSAQAFAVDVKVSGSFSIAGMYMDKTNFLKNDYVNAMSRFDVPAGISTAFYYQKLRVQTDFIFSPNLKLVTRFDALERIWGGYRGNAPKDTSGLLNPPLDNEDYTSQSSGTREENQNIAFDWAYISYISPIGLFEIGYQADNNWGTVFGNNEIKGKPVAKIAWMAPLTPEPYRAGVTIQVVKYNDRSSSAIAPSHFTDSDNDEYIVAVVGMPTKDIEFGLLYGYERVATERATVLTEPYSVPVEATIAASMLTPYFKARSGHFYLEGEFAYLWGQINWEGDPLGLGGLLGIPAGSKTDIVTIMAYLNTVVDFGMFYGGATFAYVSGDNPKTMVTKMEGGLIGGGVDFQPCLMMFNSDRAYWAGSLKGYAYAYTGMMVGSGGPAPDNGELANVWFYQGKIGVRPVAALDIMASVSYATADQRPGGLAILGPPIVGPVLHNDYGWEVDVVGTYKLTNNLSYMLGAAYWFVGDYYKGDSDANQLVNNYMLINKLTLTF